MNITEILPGIHYVGVNDRTTTRFEGLWSLPQGVSYNAYLVADEKVALIDTVEEGFGSRLTENIREAIGDRKIDYLVINHMEPDHSSSVRALRMLYPDIRIVGNAKTLQMLQGFYGIDTGTLEVKEGDSISLGSKTLSFYMAPMVHWPETMVTWCAEAGTLFSGDAFGTFGAIDGGITDSQVDPSRYWDEMRRYYACIVGKYGVPVQKALAKVRGLNPTTICSTHGPVWQREIPQVMDVYDRLSRYAGEPGVVIAYGSMYGNTEQMAERIARELAAEGTPARPDRGTLRPAAQLRLVRLLLLGECRRTLPGRIRTEDEVGGDLRTRGNEAGFLAGMARGMPRARSADRRVHAPLNQPKTWT